MWLTCASLSEACPQHGTPPQCAPTSAKGPLQSKKDKRGPDGADEAEPHGHTTQTDVSPTVDRWEETHFLGDRFWGRGSDGCAGVVSKVTAEEL